jgi:hypothetical protein
MQMQLNSARLAQYLDAYAETLAKSGNALENECLEVKRQWDVLANILDAAWIDEMSPAWEQTAQFFEEYRERTEQLRLHLEDSAGKLRQFSNPQS